MTTSTKAALVVVATLGVAAVMVHLFLPGGLPALAAQVSGSPPPAEEPAPEGPVPPAPRLTGEPALRGAEQAYDAGDFPSAIELFVAAKSDPDASRRDRAARGLQRTILAWAVTFNSPLPRPLPDDPEAEVARREAAVEKNPGERAWYDLAVYAMGAGAARKVPLLAQQALACAVEGGPVETRLNEVLRIAGPRARYLEEAMRSQSFLAPADPVAQGGTPAPAPKKPVRAPAGPPAGTFSAATKEKLAKAFEFEEAGRKEYELTGPENSQREKHRRAAYDLLKKARDLYSEAQEENPNSPDLDRHLHEVMEMLSPLRKEMGVGGR